MPLLQTLSFHSATYTKELIYFDCNILVIYDQNAAVEDSTK